NSQRTHRGRRAAVPPPRCALRRATPKPSEGGQGCCASAFVHRQRFSSHSPAARSIGARAHLKPCATHLSVTTQVTLEDVVGFGRIPAGTESSELKHRG